ncbi:MAG TPA: hypothetical protein VFS05_13165, partial [Gemmatimonadaceae bacterium]|nr:hypothetical protein [Gemmatimonadaceae bacterium]
MIVRMAKVRVLGPRRCLDDALRALQDFGLLHLADATATEGLRPLPLPAREARRRRQLQRALEDIEAALALLGRGDGSASPSPAPPTVRQLARWARVAREARLGAERLAARLAALDEERALILKYRDFFAGFQPILRSAATSGRMTAIAVIAPAAARDIVERLRGALKEATGDEWLLRTRQLASGDLALLLVLPRASAERIEHLLAEARVPEIPVPAAYAGQPLAESVPRMLA